MPAQFENLIAWGDCDAAGIVYFPRFFHFMDFAFQRLMLKGGFGHRRLLEEFGVRLPIVDVGAKFISPATYDDRLILAADVVHWGSTSFRVEYKGSRENVPVYEGWEVRVCTNFGDDGSIRKAPIPSAFKDAITAAARG